MKAHTTGFKNAIKNLGRQLRAIITYGNVTLEEEIYAVTPHFEGGILKSIMKQLDLELSVDIPLETVLNCRIGILVNGNYEMLNYGNYVVYKSEKQEDTNTYKLTCYDKMLYSMKQNEELGVPYPISIKNYLIAICNKLGLTLKTTTFQNESRMIQNELYLGLDYTYRDILDEIAQATGSIICLNENDEVLVKYPTQTNDTIDEEFLKDVNVDFGQMYGAINTIVLSRSGESDNIYYPPELPENPIEIKIKDNQIMNWNDRSDYLPGIYQALNGLYYYINDFSSTGIMYYEVGDLYNVQVGNNTYQCLMLNDEINVTTGIEEIIHTDLPEQSKTDYTKADKTDRRINQTYLIVDKQNQQISSVISQTIDRDNPDSMSNKLSKVTQTVNELNSKISDIADITTSLESNSAKLQFEDINQSEPIRVVIHPVGVNIAKLHPHTNLKPSINLVIKTRILRFENTTTNETFDYELPDDLLYYDSENYDEFILDYDSLSCVINKKCKWNNDGTVGLLPSERAVEYTFPHIELTDGDYTVQLIQYNAGYLFVRLMAQNIYTTQFATRAELNSDIRQTVDNINLSVGKKLEGYSTTTEMNSAIDVKANQITQTVSETYATKTALGNTEESFNSKIEQTAKNITQSVSETYVTNQSLEDNYSTTEQTATMISTTVSQTTKNNLKNVTVEYALGTSTTTAPTSGWSTTAPTWQQGKYMWQRTKTKTADGTENISNPTCIAGANGVSLSSITEYYAVSSSNTSAPADSAFKTTMQTMTTTNKYLWNYEIITFSDNSTQPTTKRVIGVYGDKGIGITSVANKYQVSNSNTTAPTTWKDTPQTMTATNKYLWNYEIITYSNGTTSTSTPAVIGTYGEKGDKGNTGDTGKGVKAVVAQYYLSSSKTSQTGGSWAETQPAYKKDYYYWTRTKITWTDDTVTYTTPILVEEINSLNESVAKLEITTGKISTEVSKKVGYEELGTKIQQDYESIQIAWNKISEYIQFINAQLQIKNNDKKLLMTLGKYGQYFYNDDILTGIIGTGYYKGDNSQKSLEFRLNPLGRFMGWFQKSSSSENTYYSVLYYARANSFGKTNEGIYVDKPLYVNKPLYVKSPIYLNHNLHTDYNIYVNASIFLNEELNINHGVMRGIDGGYYYEVGFGDAVNNIFFRSNRVETNISGTLYVDGREVVTNSSDARLKHDIYNSDINALDRISQIKHRKFIWNEDNKEEQIGYIAQELEDIDENYVIKSPQLNENGEVIDYIYQVNLLPILATATKAIQELKEEVDEIKEQQSKQQQFLEMLASKFDMQEEYNDIFAKETIKKSIKRAVKYDNINEQYNKPIQYSTNFKQEKNKVKDKDEDKTILAMNDNGEIYTVKEKDIKGGKE